MFAQAATLPVAGLTALYTLEKGGGQVLANVLTVLAPDATCVAFGICGGIEVTLDLRAFYMTGGLTPYGFILFEELPRHPASDGLARLARLVAEGRLTPQIAVEAPWTEIGALANRDFPGKAVLHVSQPIYAAARATATTALGLNPISSTAANTP